MAETFLKKFSNDSLLEALPNELIWKLLAGLLMKCSEQLLEESTNAFLNELPEPNTKEFMMLSQKLLKKVG